MKKLVKKILTTVCTLVLCLVCLTGCSWLEINKKNYYSQVVVTVGDKHEFTKKDLVEAFSSYGYQYYQQYGYSLEESINQTITSMIDRALLMDEVKKTISIDEDELEIRLVKQFRPPAGNIMLEFPAGLVEENEDPAVAAVRELEEETGFKGKVKKILPPSYSSPGLTSEQVFWATMEANDTPECERHTNFDESEDIETVTVKRTELFAYLEKAMTEGVLIDSKLFAYAAGLAD